MRFWASVAVILTAIILFVVYGGHQAKLANDAKKSSASSSSTSSTSTPTKSGIAVLDDLKKEDIIVGTGTEATSTSTVTVHYTGKLTDGTQFDSSHTKGTPLTFSLNQVIKGWQEGIPGMKVGGKRTLAIPAAMAYGNSERPGIPANSDLYFEVELLEVK